MLYYDALTGVQRNDHKTGWSETVEVEAFRVNVKNAAAADEDGILNPILHRYLANAVSLDVFALPAVQVQTLLWPGKHFGLENTNCMCHTVFCCTPGHG